MSERLDSAELAQWQSAHDDGWTVSYERQGVLMDEVRALWAERALMRIMSRVTYEIVAGLDGDLAYQHASSTPGPLIEALRDHPEEYIPGSYVAKVTTSWEQTDVTIKVIPHKES